MRGCGVLVHYMEHGTWYTVLHGAEVFVRQEYVRRPPLVLKYSRVFVSLFFVLLLFLLFFTIIFIIINLAMFSPCAEHF
jgi:hypothetical protein